MGLSDFLAKAEPPKRHDPFQEALDIAGDSLPLAVPAATKPGHVTPFVHDSPEWHALRARHVGGSEVSALFHVQPDYALSHYALYHVKKGTLPPPDVENERAEWGIELEAAIAHAAARRYGWKIHKGGYVSDPTTPGLGCTLDYVIEEPGEQELALGFTGPGVMEVKTVDWLIHKRAWTDEEPPLHILLQHQHQMAATGYTWGVVPALILGNTHLECYRYAARPKLIADIRARVTDFWASIREEREPTADGSEGAMLALRALYPEMVDEPVDLTGDDELPKLCAAAKVMAKERLAAKKVEEAIKAQIAAKLGVHMRAMTEGFFINMAVTPEKLGRPPFEGELIGARKEVRKLNITESAIP
jgi:predicted phage-related endonuclease